MCLTLLNQFYLIQISIGKKIWIDLPSKMSIFDNLLLIIEFTKILKGTDSYNFNRGKLFKYYKTSKFFFEYT